jgi:hypothetical protein
MSSAVADCQTIMRKITAGLFTALDGQLGAADTILLGRKT